MIWRGVKDKRVRISIFTTRNFIWLNMRVRDPQTQVACWENLPRTAFLPGAIWTWSPSGVWVWLHFLTMMRVKEGAWPEQGQVCWLVQQSQLLPIHWLFSRLSAAESSLERNPTQGWQWTCIFPVPLQNRLLLLILDAWLWIEKLLGPSLESHPLQIFPNAHSCAKYHLVHAGRKTCLCPSNYQCGCNSAAKQS